MSLSPTRLSAVHWEETGHVVGALALTGPGAVADVAALVGRALPLRVPTAEGRVLSVTLPAARLAAVAVDEEPGALTEPLSFGVETADGRPRPTLVRLTGWNSAITLTRSGLTVDLPQPAAAATAVSALVADEQETLSLRGVIGQGQTRVTLALSVPAGTYGVLVLAAGWAGRLQQARAT
ncbi:hypothetical protein [Streptomyces clavuligerus]|uniref:Uncharacterized protein n=1 Tax=Streptomyces clavuligerus TaxID=1901 RepID=E2Q5W8_STRCL|nr:hypothetical protein [Streptomyces clavuligerus]ANW21685.1 hypothetical protein BB341_27465 [Streptomyces clavuligerus]AXU16314.1 hypothetical protein D1794_28535 [Streptomyces clavuligerus]EFG05128.1 Hypothetical protein SCLAV_0052 [Streptomyces clavuligerus]MBY6306475.1 hypothetical protein [Streptomyces clavuligerus]QCS09094.1 hypothetical protein CRV15_27895 [Streptomyces clavuligerus]